MIFCQQKVFENFPNSGKTQHGVTFYCNIKLAESRVGYASHFKKKIYRKDLTAYSGGAKGFKRFQFETNMFGSSYL